MKKILLVLLFLPAVGWSQNYWLPKSGNKLVPIVPAWKVPDSVLVSGGGIAKSDSTTMPGYVTRTKFAADTTYKAAQIATKATPQQIADSINASKVKTNAVLGRYAVWDATDSLGSVAAEIIVQVDSTLQILGQRIFVAGPIPRAIRVDSIFTIGGPSTVSLVATYYQNDSLWTESAGVLQLITSPATTSSTTIGAWQSTIANPNIAANQFVWFTFTTATTASNKFIVIIRYHYGTS